MSSDIDIEHFWYDDTLIRKARGRSIVHWLVGEKSSEDLLGTIQDRHQIEEMAIQILIDNDKRWKEAQKVLANAQWGADYKP